MRKIYIGIAALAMLSCSTESTNSSSSSYDLNIEEGGITLVDFQVENGEAKSIQLLREKEIFIENDSTFHLKQPGYHCEYIDSLINGVYQGEYQWIPVSSVYSYTYSIENSILDFEWGEFKGSSTLQGKWTDSRKSEHTLEISETTLLENVQIDYKCFADKKASSPLSKQISCSEIEINNPVIGQLNIKEYYDINLTFIKEITLNGESCINEKPTYFNKENCEIRNSLINNCEDIESKLEAVFGEDFQVCKADYKGDGICDSHCMNFVDPDCE